MEGCTPSALVPHIHTHTHPRHPPCPGPLLQGRQFSSGLIYKYRNLHLWLVMSWGLHGWLRLHTLRKYLSGSAEWFLERQSLQELFISTGRWNFTQIGVRLAQTCFVVGGKKCIRGNLTLLLAVVLHSAFLKTHSGYSFLKRINLYVYMKQWIVLCELL